MTLDRGISSVFEELGLDPRNSAAIVDPKMLSRLELSILTVTLRFSAQLEKFFNRSPQTLIRGPGNGGWQYAAPLLSLLEVKSCSETGGEGVYPG